MTNGGRRLAIGVIVASLVAGCSGGDDDAGDTAPGTAAPASTGSADESSNTETTGTQPPTTVAATSVAPEPAPTTEPAPIEPSSELADSLGLDVIEILTPAEGGGDRPDLSWAPIEGADTYQVVLNAPSGGFYWGWTGTETSIPVGGLPRLVPEAAGPRLIPEMSWTVIAFDTEVRPLALGGPAPISP
jgi:hypothetical protein